MYNPEKIFVFSDILSIDKLEISFTIMFDDMISFQHYYHSFEFNLNSVVLEISFLRSIIILYYTIFKIAPFLVVTFKLITSHKAIK